MQKLSAIEGQRLVGNWLCVSGDCILTVFTAAPKYNIRLHVRFIFLVQTKMSCRSLLTSQYSR